MEGVRGCTLSLPKAGCGESWPRRGWRISVALALAAGVLAGLYAANFAAIRAVTGGDEPPALFGAYPVYFAIVFLVYLAAVRLAWSGGRRTAVAAILLGLAFRAVMLPTPVRLSTDLYRYFWDGRVQLAGVNPYAYPPEAAALAGLRDPEIHPRINRPWAPTIYPPGAQIIFRALAWIAPNSLLVLRGLLIAGEAMTMLLLLALLARSGLPEGRVVVYAWAPLPALELVQAAHIDAVMLPLVLAAVLAAAARRPGLAGGLLGGAALIKLYPAALLPVLWRRGDRRLPLAFLAVVFLGYLPYTLDVGSRVLGFLPSYFEPGEEFNVGLRSLLTDRIGLTGSAPRLLASALLAALLVAALHRFRAMRRESAREYFVVSGLAVGAYLLLVPSTMHPWYVVWLIPFLAALPHPAWWYMTGTIPLSYLAYLHDPVRVPTWAVALEYLPACAALLCSRVLRHGRLRPRTHGREGPRHPEVPVE